jgi:2-dehydropantoate 2-reductase
MEILVYGAGVVGSQYAARLRRSGHMVTLVARGQRATDLREQGIVLEAANTGQKEIVHVIIKETLEPDDSFDWVIVAVRKNQVPEILPVLADNHNTPNILFLGNNPSGAGELIKALGRDRVVLGFGGVGGLRRGATVYYYYRPGRLYGRTFLGELDGRITPRLLDLVQVLGEARLPGRIVPDMDAWLKSHAALFNPLALAVYVAGGDNYRLAHTPDGLLLAVRAIRESLEVLHSLSVPIKPASLRALEWLPEPLLMLYLRGLMNTKAGEIGIAGPANAARDEMGQVADEFYELVRASGRSTPALDRLRSFLNPAQPPLLEGSAELPVDMRSVWIGLGIAAGLIVVGMLTGRRGPRR